MDQRRKVLVIDDDRVIVSVCKAHLEHHNFEVELATDVASAFAALRAFGPDVVVLDLEMPSRSGVDWLTAVRKVGAFQDLPVLVFTAQPDGSPLLRQLGDSQITGVLSKRDWNPDALVAAVEWLLPKRSAPSAATTRNAARRDRSLDRGGWK